jgi:hypothetical protein
LLPLSLRRGLPRRGRAECAFTAREASFAPEKWRQAAALHNVRAIIGGCGGPAGLAEAGLFRYFRNRGEQRLCIRMLRLLQHFVRRPDFDDASGLHHGDPRR